MRTFVSTTRSLSLLFLPPRLPTHPPPQCLPIYYSSGSRLRAFAVAALFGAASQFAGALAAFFLFRLIRPTVVVAFTGFLFSTVAGLLLYIVVGGVLPLSRASDPEDRFVTKSVLAGAAFFYFVLSVFSYV
ncbi:MAG: hypothetical protein BJ554DRAFT_5599 [Olpidium bornovanus]|uniref:Uncharacterized protein n=1 Tax=Olpidium bornovanus TaxID=278681 RepID=A0A8H8A2C4_9FUNG|nr:MAG: hypothetical protein BJ554DRAFT_5599 [Olpidium bornovanus]